MWAQMQRLLTTLRAGGTLAVSACAHGRVGHRLEGLPLLGSPGGAAGLDVGALVGALVGAVGLDVGALADNTPGAVSTRRWAVHVLQP